MTSPRPTHDHPQADPCFGPADTWPLDRLAALWNRAYDGYFVPVCLTPEQLARHIARSDIDLGLSVVGSLAGQPFGLSLAAVRRDGPAAAAWIGGFGVVPEFRRRGLAGRLIAHQLDRLDGEGVATTGLEVIEANPARRVYAAAGFLERRRLVLLEGPLPPPGPDAGTGLALPGMLAAHASLHAAAAPTWRRQAPTLARAARDDGTVAVAVGPDGRPTAYGLALAAAGRLTLLDAAAVDAGAAADLLGALARRWPGMPLRLVDEPDTSPLAEALVAAGMTVGIAQVEMERPRPA